jgi:hypothetical protein
MLISVVSIVLILLIGAGVHFAPTFVAIYRDSNSKLGVFLVNLLLGWTLVGWVAALVWALASPRSAAI